MNLIYHCSINKTEQSKERLDKQMKEQKTKQRGKKSQSCFLPGALAVILDQPTPEITNSRVFQEQASSD